MYVLSNVPEESAMENRLIIYPEFDERIERDYLYTVCVTQGGETRQIPVYNHTEDSRVNRNPLDGNRADEFRRFSTFAFSGEGVRVDIRVNRDFHDYAVIPAAKKFRHAFHEGVISVFLDRPDYFLIRLDGRDHTILSVFADALETELPCPGENVYTVGRWQEVPGGILKITQPHTTVYIPAGCVLNARVEIRADDCKVIGRGAIVDPVGDIYRYDASKLDTGVVLLVDTANRTLIDGIHMLDAKAFQIEVIGTWQKTWATGNRIRHVKLLATQMCTDGITFCYYTKDSHAEHCFVYAGDNALVYEEGAHYEDMTVGTTCNAIFPQTDVVDSSVENIYVFRADEGIINCEYCGENGVTKLENHTIRNLSAIDITYTPYFLYVEIPERNPVISARGGLTIENVRLPDLRQTRTPVFYRNIAGGNYQVTLKNLSIGDRLIEAITPETTGGEVFYGTHTFIYQKDSSFSDSYIFLPRNVIEYDQQTNIFIGSVQIYFNFPILKENHDILLPANQLQAELRTDHMAKTQSRNGVDYLCLSDLVGSGMAKSVELNKNQVVIFPNDNSGNLLLPDCGIISKYTEYICYASHLVTRKEDGNLFYRMICTRDRNVMGIFRLLGEEFGKYGEGIYRLSFAARANRNVKLRAAIVYSGCPSDEKIFAVDAAWKECEMEIAIGSEQLRQENSSMIICREASKQDWFDLKNIRLEKIKSEAEREIP